jgi:hypothetical protein
MTRLTNYEKWDNGDGKNLRVWTNNKDTKDEFIKRGATLIGNESSPKNGGAWYLLLPKKKGE